MNTESKYIVCFSCNCDRPEDMDCRPCIPGLSTYNSVFIKWPTNPLELEHYLEDRSAQIIYILFKSRFSLFVGISSRRLEEFAQKYGYKIVGIGKHCITYNYYTIKNPLCYLCDGLFYSDGLVENLDSLTGAIDDTLKCEGIIDRAINPQKSERLTHLIIRPSSEINAVADLIISKLSEVWPEGGIELVVVDPYFYALCRQDNDSVINLFTSIVQKLHEKGIEKISVVHSRNYCENQSRFTGIARSCGITLTTLKYTNIFHDRFWYFPNTDRGIVIGTSLNGLNHKYCLTEILQGEDVREIESIVNNL